jgi:predicted nucleic acid-binding protein
MPGFLLDTNHLGLAVVMVAALARQMRLTILTTDQDFQALPDIRTADWSSP